MNYEQLYLHKTKRVEKFKNIDFKIFKYTIYREIISDSDGINHKNNHYIIELEDTNKQIGILEMSIQDIWLSIKKYIKVGSEVKANGWFHYDENDNLIFVQIESFKYDEICVSDKEISSKFGRTTTAINILEDKKRLLMLIVWIVSLFLISTNIFFLIILLIDTLILAIYASINNKKYGDNADAIFEKVGLEEIEQTYIEVRKEHKGILNKSAYNISEIE